MGILGMACEVYGLGFRVVGFRNQGVGYGVKGEG